MQWKFVLVCCLSFYASTCSGQYSDEAWREASTYLKSAMNASYNECKNFYKHVCGSFGRSNDDEGEDDTATSEFETKQKTITSQLIDQIKGLDEPKNDTNGTFQDALRGLYDGCIRSQQMFPDQILRRTYNALGERIGYLPILGGQGDKPWRVMGIVTRELGGSLILSPTVYQPDNAGKPILYLSPQSAAEGSDYNETQTRALIVALSTVTGKNISVQALDSLMADLTAFYDDWDNITSIDRSTFQLRNSVANLTHTLRRRNANVSIDWNAYLDGLLPTEVHQQWLADPSKALIEISDYGLLYDLAALLTRHSPETILSYAFLDSLTNSLAMNDKSASELSVAAGNSEDRCVQFAYTYAPSAAARVLLDFHKIDPVAWRNEILLVASHIRAAFRYLITTMDWLNAADKMKINNRLDGINVNPGLPDWIDDDEKILAKTPRFDTTRTLYENEFEYAKQQWNDESSQLVGGMNLDDPDPDFTVSSQYAARTVDINLGFSLPPQFKIAYPLPLKYGGLGYVIAHEFFHAFDPDVVAEEEEGEDINQYFQRNSMKEYQRRRSCIIQQYSKYCNKKIGKCVSGDSSVNDNIADVDGLKVAYAAYKFVSQVLGGEPPVPDFIGRTGDQMFFIAFARLWCARKNKLLFLLSAGGQHSPPRARVDLPVANFPAFAASFHCPVGSKFAPLKKCSLWGESFSPNPAAPPLQKKR